MSIKSYSIVGAALLACGAFAQQSLGTIGDMNGLVTVVDGGSVTSATSGKAILNGQRFVASSGSVTLRLDSGCVLTLQPDRAVTIDSTKTCRELSESITTASGAPLAGGASFAGGAGGGGGGGGSAGLGLLAVTGLAGGYWLVQDKVLSNNQSVSGR